MQITLIAATDRHRVIGQKGDLPWNLPPDLKRFKRQTMGKPIVMGRRTHESIGRALPGRTNLVLTRREDYTAENCRVVSSPDQALNAAGNAGEIMVIGGATVYGLFLSRADRLLLTVIHSTFPGDTFFPELDAGRWHAVDVEDFPAGPNNPYDHTLYKLELRASTAPRASTTCISQFPCPPFLENVQALGSRPDRNHRDARPHGGDSG